jgi:putative heme-binding domain-containing protein
MLPYRPLLAAAVLLALALSSAPSGESRPAEPWAAPGLPVAEGLELWLDAGRLNAARKSEGIAPLKAGDPVPAWPDASGHRRHVRQEAAAARPRLVRVGDAWVVRFGGAAYLRHKGLARSAEGLTVFVVAAPHDNPGDFRGLVAANAIGRRDYETGFTLDLGSAGGTAFDRLNVEGRGFGGERNLLTGSSPFGTLHVIEAVADPGRKQVRLVLDGKPAGERPFQPGPLSLDEITVGARYYTNGPGPQEVRGPFTGDIAEVLVYGRALTAREADVVRRYLERRHARLKEDLPAALKLPGALGQPLVRVADPPPVQVLVPGFTVRRIPVDLPNINNVRYRADGKLVALGYNGNVYLLSDTDGDGLEDHVELFWENKGQIRGPIGLALTPPGYKLGQGVFVPSKGKLSLIVDTDGDGKADKEIIVAQGWKEIPQAVDAIGVALDKSGSVYFALGTADYANAYLIDKEGRGHYDLKSERGTVQKVSPDFRKRETVCTGVRFPVAMAFNRHGDLFCTDQEGATWLPNGNPFDELLHIQPGRHYGFPPRHPRHLPGVIDEPSVYDYGPQHQSTCGLVFNESAGGGPTFGPRGWAGDALIAGESRGKIYRTKLVKTPAGYVAQNHLLARLNMLTIDVCVSPQGDLVVTTHSGPPDWGTGPGGKGRLYKISYTAGKQPQPVAVWAAGPQEVWVAFDRPLDPQELRGLAGQAKITFGDYVRPGDRFEVLHPPYAVVQMQQRTPRFDLPVRGAQVTADRRTLILTTDPQRQAVHYALMLPGIGRPAQADGKRGELPQHPQIDLGYTFTGVTAHWEGKGPGASWSGWLPHLDLAVSRAFTAGSAAHEALWQALKGPGTLTLKTRLDLVDMLRPAVQVGAHLDYEWPAEKVTVALTAAGPFTLRAGKDKARPAARTAGGHYEASVTVSGPRPGDLLPVEVILPSAGGVPDLRVSYHTAEDSRPRALHLRRLLLPWAEPPGRPAEAVVRRDVPELRGGSWARGRKVFFSEEALCGKCHVVRGQGGAIGPDLSNLVHRDYESVLRDIAEPSFAINPDFITYVASLKDGRVLTGTVRAEGGKLLIGDTKGEVTAVAKGDVEALEPAPKSVMPEGLPKLLGPERLKDLLTFLLTEPPHMPEYGRGPLPPPRTRAEVQAVLAGAPEPPAKTRPLHIVLVAGTKDHGPGEHDYPAWQKVWAELLAAADGVRVSTAWDWPRAKEFREADVMVFYQRGAWTPRRAQDIDAYLARGGGLVYIHWAIEGGPDAPGFARRIGLASNSGKTRFRHGPLDLAFAPGAGHPVARNFAKVHFHDESYWGLVGDPKGVRLLASSVEDGRPRPQFWTLEPGKGRVFVSVLGHYAWTFDDPLFRILLLRGLAWSAREPVDRFNALATMGARLAE